VDLKVCPVWDLDQSGTKRLIRGWLSPKTRSAYQVISLVALLVNGVRFRDRPALHGGDPAHQITFEVGGLIVVDDVSLGQFVDHSDHSGQQGLSGLFVLFVAQFFDCVTNGFMLVPVAQANRFVSPDPL